MKWLCLLVIGFSAQCCIAKETLFSLPVELALAEPVLTDQTRISDPSYNNLKTGLSRQLVNSEKEHFHLDLSVLRPAYNGLTRGNFTAQNNPLLQEGNAMIRLSITKSF